MEAMLNREATDVPEGKPVLNDYNNDNVTMVTKDSIRALKVQRKEC
jgi:hypothetical protein